MKKIVFFFVLCLPMLGQSQQNGFSITGNLTGMPDQSKVVITNPDDPTDTIAVAVSKKETFLLKGKIEEVKLYNLAILPAGKKCLLFLDNSAMVLRGSLDSLQKISLSGSPAHDGFMDFQKKFDPLFRQYSQLNEAANQTGVNDSLMQVYKALVQKVANTGEEFATTYRNQNIAPFMWATIMQVVNDLPRVEKSLLAMSPEVQSSFYGKYVAERISEGRIGSIGSAALEFVQADTSGKPVSLSSFKGKYVLVDFWASWCGPCRKENPNLVAAFARFREKNFTVLGVSLDDNRDRWIRAIKDDQLNWTQVSDLKYWQNEVAVKYKIQNIPQNLLIDPNGVIIGKNLRGQELELKLCEVLGCR